VYKNPFEDKVYQANPKKLSTVPLSDERKAIALQNLRTILADFNATEYRTQKLKVTQKEPKVVLRGAKGA